jgi:acetyl-CoA acetyltransferase
MAPWLPTERGSSPTVDAARACFEQAGIGPDEVQVAQIQDSESGAEIMHMAENGFCADGEQERMIFDGETEIGGRLPINTDGGLLANGEPIGASGLRQIHEVCLQLRGDAGQRQVPGNPRVGYTQVYGAPGVGCCTLLTV